MLNTQVDLVSLEQQHTSGVYLKRDLQVVRGFGARVEDAEGRSYIDCVGGQGSANLGHCHPAVVEAIQRQAAELITCTEVFHNPVRARYQAALCEAAQMPRVFLCNSGAEAIEGALKFARASTGRTTIISTMRGFHGRTMGALATTWEKTYREPFAALLSGVVHVPFNNIDKLREVMDDTVAGVIVEPVQGEGGVHPVQEGYLRTVQDLCHEHGAMLILDEVQTGFGRTGSLFAYTQDGIQPDFMAVSKSIAGGLPMGAVLIGERVGTLPPASHGTTFGGNPLVCAAAEATLEVLQTTDIIENTRTRGEAVREHFRTHLPERAYREVRGRGLLLGVELRGKVAPILRELQAHGVLALPAGATVLRLLPPLVISDDDLWQAVEIIEEVLSNAVQ